MIKERNLSNLGDDGDAITAFEIILLYFGKGYLLSNKKHRLPKLWSRLDRLATIELYVLGKSIMKLIPENEEWLKGAIRSIKKQPANSSHGFFTEIIYFGMFSLYNSVIKPAENSNPGYDFSIELPNKTKQFISIKNIDISDYQKNFQQNCRKLRRKWIEKLRTQNKSLGLRIVSSKTLDDENFNLLIDEIKSLNLNPSRKAHNINADLLMYIQELPESQYQLSLKNTSETVQIFCPAHKSEQKRYVKKIRDAANNIAKHTCAKENISRVVFMRMHVNSDYNFIAESAKKLVNNTDNKVDCIVCYQPSYVRNENNASLLNHCFILEVSARYAMQMAGSDHYRVDTIIGSVSQKQAPVKIIDLETGKNTQLPTSDYFFQQGDIYLLAKKGNDGSLSCNNLGSPAPGIKKHGVINVKGSSAIIKSKTTPEFEDLMII